MISRGFFVITDVTGYTEFLTQSGLEEAQSILDHLFEGLVKAFKPPLVISNFQGDAILSYVPETSAVHGQTFFELIEGLYFAFAGLVEQMERSAACACLACENLPKLDLKIFVHYGEYAIQRIGGREELSGPDVILVHRMMKNHVREETGMVSYMLLSEPALKKLELSIEAYGLKQMRSEYEHLGSIELFVYDLSLRHRIWKENHRTFVQPDQAVITHEQEMQALPHVVWDFLTQPEHMMHWMTFEVIKPAHSHSARLERGTVFRCIRKYDNIEFTITDWHPFEYFTIQSVGQTGIPYEATYSFLPIGNTTTVKLFARPVEKADRIIVERLRAEFQSNMDRLRRLIAISSGSQQKETVTG